MGGVSRTYRMQEVLDNLLVRLTTASERLHALATTTDDSEKSTRLLAKQEGVSLSLSYLYEELQRLSENPGEDPEDELRLLSGEAERHQELLGARMRDLRRLQKALDAVEAVCLRSDDPTVQIADVRRALALAHYESNELEEG